MAEADAHLSDFSLLDGHPTNGSTVFASANFSDAEESRPTAANLEALGGNDAINGIVTQTITRHLAEVIPSSSPSFTSYTPHSNDMRRAQPLQNVCPHGLIAVPTASCKHIGHIGSVIN